MKKVAKSTRARAQKKTASTASDPKPLPADADAIVKAFEQSTGLSGLSAELKDRSDGSFLIIKVGNPTERFYSIVNNINETLPSESRFHGRVTLRREGRQSWLTSPEARLFQRTLSERLTVGRESVREEFFRAISHRCSAPRFRSRVLSIIWCLDGAVPASQRYSFMRRRS